MSSTRKYVAFVVTLLGALALDLASKEWARQTLRPLRRIVVVEGYFDFLYSENPGAAFSLLRDASARYFLLGMGVVGMIVLLVMLRRAPAGRLSVAVELGLIAGGALGNMIDRARFGVVTDFVLWKIHDVRWPVFNVADAELVVGVLALLFFGIPKRVERAPETDPT